MRVKLPAPFRVESEADLASEAFAALREVSRGLNREFRCEAARCGLSVAEAQLLALLHDASCAPPLDGVVLDGFRAHDVAEALRQRGLVGPNGSGLGLSERGVTEARRLAARLPLWEATPLVGALRDLGRSDSEELVRLLNELAGLVARE